MKVRTLFRRLSYGELSSLAISSLEKSIDSTGSGEIHPSEAAKVMTYVNEGLIRLYSRFVLKESDLIIQEMRGVTNYHLLRENAEFGSRGRPSCHPYIKDLPKEPFNEDVIRILAVYDAHGCKLPLNDQDDPWSLFTPQPDVLQVPHPREGRPLGVTYQARHKPLCETRDDINDVLDQEIHLNSTLEKALQLYVASEVYAHTASDDAVAKSMAYLGRCDAICAEIEAKDLVNQTWATSHDKLRQRGFV